MLDRDGVKLSIQICDLEFMAHVHVNAAISPYLDEYKKCPPLLSIILGNR
jgi:hypothetical protein